MKIVPADISNRKEKIMSKAYLVIYNIVRILNITGPYYILFNAIKIAPNITKSVYNMTNQTFWAGAAAFLGSVAISIIIAVISTFVLLIMNIFAKKTPYVATFITRIVLAPVIIGLFLLTAGMMNPFLYWAMWLPPLIAFWVITESALPAIGTLICSAKHHEINAGLCVLFGILNFVVIIGFISNIIMLVLGISSKNKNEKMAANMNNGRMYY